MRYLAAALILSTLVIAATCVADDSTDQWINYQGRIVDTNGVPVVDGNYDVSFYLYDVPTGGQPVWSERWTSLVVQKGLFSVLLGSAWQTGDPRLSDVDWTTQKFLALKVNNPEQSEMQPRQQIAYVPWAFRALSAQTVSLTTADTSPVVARVDIPSDAQWHDVPDTVATFTVDAASVAIISYVLDCCLVNGGYVDLDLLVDGSPQSPGTIYKAAIADCGSTVCPMTQTLHVPVERGTHTVTLRIRNHTGNEGAYYFNRRIQATVLGRQAGGG